MRTTTSKISDLTRYTRDRATRDPEFAESLESGYTDFKVDALLRQAREKAGLTQEEVAERLATKKSRSAASRTAPETSDSLRSSAMRGRSGGSWLWSSGLQRRVPRAVGAVPRSRVRAGAGTAGRLDPAGELAPDIGRIDISCEEETGFEDGLLPHNLQEMVELHGSKMPRMASYCNESSARPTPRRLLRSSTAKRWIISRVALSSAQA